MAVGQVSQDRQQRVADRSGESADPQHPGWIGIRIEVEPRGVDGREDVDGVVGQAPASRRQPHATALRFDELRAGLLAQRRDLLRHRRRGQPVRVGDRAHRPEPGQLEQQPEPTGVHTGIVRYS